jgi:CheY-like chemotaxis protein
MVAEFESDPVTVMADAGQIHQVVMNLCVNAAHAIGDKPGRVLLGLSRVQVDAQLALTREGLSPGPHVRLTVEDTGSGIEEATLSRIFEPFFTTKAPGEGTGLGLAVVHGIVKDHGGTIAVSSSVGVGTKFELFFPEHQAPPPEVRSHAVLPRGRGENVLFVDDEPSLCSAGGMMLERIGYQAVTFTSPAEALARFRSEPEAFDLLITDLTMPGMTGIDLARSVLELRPGLPVVLVSGFGGKWTPENIREMGIRDLIPKPVSLLLLATAVRRAIDGATDDAG